MWFSDLENLLSIGRIFYQLGESYLNLFLLHKVENLWSVRNLWSIFTSLSALEDFFIRSCVGGGGLLPPNKWPPIQDFQPNISQNAFILRFYTFCGFCSNRILPYFPLTSHISHKYKGINTTLIVRGPIKPYIFWIKIILAIFLAKTRPVKTIFSALTNLTIDFDWSKI